MGAQQVNLRAARLTFQAVAPSFASRTGGATFNSRRPPLLREIRFTLLAVRRRDTAETGRRLLRGVAKESANFYAGEALERTHLPSFADAARPSSCCEFRFTLLPVPVA
jgi:hypothetical protein